MGANGQLVGERVEHEHFLAIGALHATSANRGSDCRAGNASTIGCAIGKCYDTPTILSRAGNAR